MQPTDNLHPPILDQIEAYETMREELERNYFGRWVIIHNGLYQGDYDSFDNAEDAAEKMGINPVVYLVKQVGVDPVTIIPASESGL